MKLTYNWLKEYVDFGWSPQELAEKLTKVRQGINDVRFLEQF
jgi:hypothetical protein